MRIFQNSQIIDFLYLSTDFDFFFFFFLHLVDLHEVYQTSKQNFEILI